MFSDMFICSLAIHVHCILTKFAKHPVVAFGKSFIQRISIWMLSSFGQYIMPVHNGNIFIICIHVCLMILNFMQSSNLLMLYLSCLYM